MTDRDQVPAEPEGVGVPVEEVLAGYRQALAEATERAILAEATVRALQAKAGEQ